VHLTEVALLLAEATEGSDPELVMAGLLHDTLEDTATTREELAAVFGDDVASLVVEVTDDKAVTVSRDVCICLDQQTRKRLQVEHAAEKTRRARMIMIADKTANLHSLRESPPVGWSARRRREYVAWAREVAAACGDTNGMLERTFQEAARFLSKG
jgi:GTP diphosphokinase / guanosine-3',5'-bis(diphosphate) 3'-diphosphatase